MKRGVEDLDQLLLQLIMVQNKLAIPAEEWPAGQLVVLLAWQVEGPGKEWTSSVNGVLTGKTKVVYRREEAAIRQIKSRRNLRLFIKKSVIHHFFQYKENNWGYVFPKAL